MRRWGVAVTLFYALVVMLLLTPGIAWLVDAKTWNDCLQIYDAWLIRAWVGILVGGQLMLLFVSVDTSWKRLKPRQHVLVSLATVALLLGVLASAAIWSILAGILGDKMFDGFLKVLTDAEWKMLGWWLALWLLWGIVFFFYVRRVPERAARVVGWLIRGSVLELLIAVPCHVLVRNRQDCSAPVATSFGIATGVAIMLLSFGPGVLMLYKKRLDQYAAARKSSSGGGSGDAAGAEQAAP